MISISHIQMSKRDQVQEKKIEILDLARRHGAVEIRLFGSVAAGQDSAESDFDFLVRMADDRSLLDFIGLWQDLEELLGGKVDLVSEGGISPYLEKEILEGAQSL